jgi:hypothetical protein
VQLPATHRRGILQGEDARIHHHICLQHLTVPSDKQSPVRVAPVCFLAGM